MSSGVRELYNKVTFLLNCKTPPITGGGCYLPIIIEGVEYQPSFGPNSLRSRC